MTTVGQLREQAAPWTNRPVPAPPGRTVDTTDRADWAVWDQINHDCLALHRLDADLTAQYGTPGLVGDLWMSAYAQDPQLRDPAETTPEQRSNRAITAAMLGTPEHHELRTATVGDPYAAAMSVLAQAPALRRMLRELDPRQRQRTAHQAREEAEEAAQLVAERVQAAQDAAAAAAARTDDSAREGHGEDKPGKGAASQDGADSDGGQGEAAEGGGSGEVAVDSLPVPRPYLVDAQRAISEATAAAEEVSRAAQAVAALGAGDEHGDQAMLAVRATARKSCADAAEALEAETTAMNAWGAGAGERERMDPDARMRLARKLQTGKLKKFAQLVGRFQQMSQAQRARRVEHARGEYVGVTVGDDLTSLVPAELVNLALPALRATFAVRYAERQLMVYEQRGEEHEGQGAVIVCVDCSDSMRRVDEHGISGEAYAKGLALALLEQARDATPTREYAAILFSKEVDAAIVFPADEPVKLADRIRLAETFTAGGTAFAPPLEAAVDLLEAEYNTTGRQRADLVFITDGVAKLSERWLQRWSEQRKRLGFRCFGIQIGHWADESAIELLDTFCDDVRRIEDLTDTHATADIFRAV